MPNRDTPQRLVEAWLDFHQKELCRNLDAVFAFDGSGMEIWCRSEENSDYRKLSKIVEQLLSSHDVELYTTRPPKDDGENDALPWATIPPSLAENRELRLHLRPFAELVDVPRVSVITYVDEAGQTHTYTEVLPSPPGTAAANAIAADRVLISRLIIWVKLVTRNNRIMRQYAADIPELINTAFEPAFSATLRRRAMDICRKHAKDLVKSIRDLNENISNAFPKPSAKTMKKIKEAKKEPGKPSSVVIEMANIIAADARDLSGRIYRFIYPSQHTVDIDELQKPGLLVSLDALESETRNFELALASLSAP